jgi:hypothetical protein
MTVPEAAMDEEHLPSGWEYQVRRSWKILSMEQIPVAQGV